MLQIYLIVLSLAAFGLYGYDKARAVNRQWRVSERTLLAVGLAGGAWGALLGMMLFRHKIRRTRFWVILVPAALFYLWLFVLLSAGSFFRF